MLTTITSISLCLTAILAFLLGRCILISNSRANRLTNQKTEIQKLQNRLAKIADSSPLDRYYEIEEDELSEAYNINLQVYVRVSSCYGERIDTVCYCLIKSFPFADDKEFAQIQAQELLDKLNEK